MKKIEIFEGDKTILTCKIPDEYIDGDYTFMIKLDSTKAIIKSGKIKDRFTEIVLSEEDTVTRIGSFKYELRVKKDKKTKVVEQGTIEIKDSIIVNTDTTATPPIAIITTVQGANTSSGSSSGTCFSSGKSKFTLDETHLIQQQMLLTSELLSNFYSLNTTGNLKEQTLATDFVRMLDKKFIFIRENYKAFGNTFSTSPINKVETTGQKTKVIGKLADGNFGGGSYQFEFSVYAGKHKTTNEIKYFYNDKKIFTDVGQDKAFEVDENYNLADEFVIFSKLI